MTGTAHIGASPAGRATWTVFQRPIMYYSAVSCAATALVVVFLTMASGCGGGGGGGGNPTVVALSGTAVQSEVGLATVTAYAVDPTNGQNGMQLGSTTTDLDGTFRLVLSPAPMGPIRLTVSGGVFVSEMNGVGISPPSPISVLIANSTTVTSGISINPLSEFVSSSTIGNLKAGTATFAGALSSATATIERDYALTADPATILPDFTSATVGTDAGNLGLILGALINEDQYLCPAAPGGLVTALSSDIQDGIFDGTIAGAPISYCGSDLSALAGITQFQDALSGLQQLASVTQAFDFGGTGNILTINDVANIALDGTQVYPLAPPAAIDAAISNAAPPSVNQFANPPVAAMNAERQNAVGTRLTNGMVLIAGGLNPAGILSSTDLYNPNTNRFANPQSATMSFARAYATATLLPNGNVLIMGGSAKLPSALSSSDLYIAKLNCFAGEKGTPCAVQAPPPAVNDGRDLATAILLPNGKVLIAGGNDGFGNINSCDLYDPVKNCFAGNAGTACAAQKQPFMNRARDVATATLLSNGKVLVAGGFSVADATNTTELYDTANNCFAGVPGTPCQTQSAPSMKVARFLASAVLLPNGKVLIAGGFNVADGVLASAELYDPANNCFAGNPGAPCAGQTTPSMNVARQAASITLLPNGKVLIAGGSDTTKSLSSTELYDPVNNCFAGNTGTACASQVAPPMNVARENDVAVLLPNGKVLIAGGGDGHIADASTDLYTP